MRWSRALGVLLLCAALAQTAKQPNAQPEPTTIRPSAVEPEAPFAEEPETTHSLEIPAEPETEAESEVEAETETEAESEAESETESEAEQEAEPEEEFAFFVSEPIPEWQPALDKWGAAWPFHRYGFALLFTFLFVNCLVALGVFARYAYSLRHSHGPMASSSKHHRMELVCGQFFLLSVFSYTRTFMLWVDPYLVEPVVAESYERLNMDIGFPFISAAFSCVLSVLLLATFKHRTMPRTAVLVFLALPVVSFLGFRLILFFVELATGTNDYLLWICQAYFAVWAFVISITWLVCARRVIRVLQVSAKRTSRPSITGKSISRDPSQGSTRGHTRTNSREPMMSKPRSFSISVIGNAHAKKYRSNRVLRVVRLTYGTSVLWMCISVVHWFGLFSVFSVLSEEIPGAWEWLAYQTVSRTLEVAMVGLLCISVANDLLARTPLGYICMKMRCVAPAEQSLSRPTTRASRKSVSTGLTSTHNTIAEAGSDGGGEHVEMPEQQPKPKPVPKDVPIDQL